MNNTPMPVAAHKLAAGAIRAQRVLDHDCPPAANRPTKAYIDAMADAMLSAGVDIDNPATLAVIDATAVESGVYRQLYHGCGCSAKQLRALAMEYSPFVAMYGKGFPKAALTAAGVR